MKEFDHIQPAGITQSDLDAASSRYHSGFAPLITDSIVKNGILNTSFSYTGAADMAQIFSDEIEPMEITNQKKSGRCWMFAGTNLCRYHLHKKLKIKNDGFELSQSYLMFWDKLEKANYFLESVLDTAGEKKDSRVVMWLFQNPLNDGGQWDMLVSLIEKYGLVPKYAMQESFHSSNSGEMNAVLCRKVRRDGILLRSLFAAGKSQKELHDEKEKMIGEFYGLMCCFLGEPPKTFDFVYRDQDNAFHRDSDLTPVGFYHKYFGEGYLGDFVSVINAPTSDKPFGRTYTVRYLGNVVGGRPVTYLNLPTEELERLACTQIQHGEPVWFGSDVGKESDRELGIMDTKLYRKSEVLQTALDISKADMLDYGESCLTHAMMLLGVDVKDGQIQKWKVENSWGKDVGEKGFFVMSNAWFKDYVCQVVINRKYLSAEQAGMLDQAPVVLEPWDPIGSLAF